LLKPAHEQPGSGRSPADSLTTVVAVMPVIQQNELRNSLADVLCRAEAGEQFTITAAGRAVAQLGPVRKPAWVSGHELAKVWNTPAPETLAEDLERIPPDECAP
jgi:prevent-host-death family protein